MYKELKEFLNDIKKYEIFSHQDYNNSNIELKLLKIKLLNEYYKLEKEFIEIKKQNLYVDFDGVILDTFEKSKLDLFNLTGISLDTHTRDNKEKEKIVSEFFKNINWKKLINESKEINRSLEFLNFLNESEKFNLTIYSAVNSEQEIIAKKQFLRRHIKNINCKFINAKLPKLCDNKSDILIDDDDFNLNNWNGKPIHFKYRWESKYPSITTLGEIYYLFNEDEPLNLEKTYVKNNH